MLWECVKSVTILSIIDKANRRKFLQIFVAITVRWRLYVYPLNLRAKFYRQLRCCVIA